MKVQDYIFFGFLILIALWIWVYIVRWVFKIQLRERNQVATIRLLEAIARASNVDEQVIKSIEERRLRSGPDTIEEAQEKEAEKAKLAST